MKKIAVIGSGISGLTSAYLLSKKHQVTVFEKNSYIGGHTATVDVSVNNQSYAIDTGFIVFNDRTYPNFIKLLGSLGVESQPTEMSFSVRNFLTGLEYNGHSINSLFAQRRNIINPKFWSLIIEIVRFNKICKHYLSESTINQEITLGDFLAEHNFSDYFAKHYILPMGAAIWSCSLAQITDFQFSFFVSFFSNHGLLNIVDRPQWSVIKGGSRSYIKPLTASFADRIELNCAIEKVTRSNNKVQLYFKAQSETPKRIEEFDEVVFACHSDQALTLLDDASRVETEVLTNLPYSENRVVLHTDNTLLPIKKRAWASWNYFLSDNEYLPASVTYNMNILQGLSQASDKPTFCVTLNPQQPIANDKILGDFTYHHPVFSLAAFKAKSRRKEICGHHHTHFAGAYWHNGFHEDGVVSAIEVAKRFDCYL